MRAGREEKQMRVNEIRDAKRLKSRYKELDEGNGIRDAKGERQKQRRRFSCLPLFVTRLPASRICL
ncbi:hypothetical protein CWO02_12515 [Vibrio splendidus]|nr:hypothetical protein CWO02_12515 [Vibrio splendidus]